MDITEALSQDHARMRRRAAGLQSMLGPEREVGWSDEADCDMDSFRAAAKELLDELLAHEIREKQGLRRVWALRGRRPELEEHITRSHNSLNSLTGLLRAAAEYCDGRHVYSVRALTAQLREVMEAYFAYEENSTFPLLDRPPR